MDVQNLPAIPEALVRQGLDVLHEVEVVERRVDWLVKKRQAWVEAVDEWLTNNLGEHRPLSDDAPEAIRRALGVRSTAAAAEAVAQRLAEVAGRRVN